MKDVIVKIIYPVVESQCHFAHNQSAKKMAKESIHSVKYLISVSGY